ncbi:hypothetical protein KFE25_014272 [Diacronema lutheri]|uniref:TAFII28-like protein domain-containing protein n=2 Tax=Diacronema lutheri TaxID=2081491 RepID=A0A8J5XFV4_DIALT|nr:hypothetical protein KFE25_014272 [Diacronema lutheri]
MDQELLEAELERAAEEMEEHEWLSRRRDAELRKGALIDQWTREADAGRPEMLERYEYSRRASFKPGAMKRLMCELTGTTVDDDSVIVVRGIAKLFVAELVELAADVRAEAEPDGPIRPAHVRDALNRMTAGGVCGPRKRSKFWR